MRITYQPTAPAIEIWQDLITLQQNPSFPYFDFPIWKNGKPGGDVYERPLRYMQLTGTLKPLRLGEFQPSISHLTKVNDELYVASRGESSGPDALANLSTQFDQFLGFSPNNILVVGSIGYDSIYDVLKWMFSKNWHVPVTVVDSSEVPLNLDQKMLDHNYFGWNPGIELIHSDILDYQSEEKYDLILMDIVSAYAARGPYNRNTDPFATYKQILTKLKHLVSDDGIIFSRTVSYGEPKQSEPHHFASNQVINKRIITVRQNLGDLANDIPLSYMRDHLKTIWTHESEFKTTCAAALWSIIPRHPTEGKEGMKNFIRIYNEIFRDENTDYIRVHNQRNDWNFLTFLNRV
jgi:hypothetical protein